MQIVESKSEASEVSAALRCTAKRDVRITSLGLLFVMLAGFLVAPIWIVAWPPLLDYPNHLASAFVLAHLKDPAYHFNHFFRAEWGLYPYLAEYLILVGLERFMSVELAGRILLSMYLLAFPLSVWFFVRQVNPGQDSMAFWGLLAAHNLFFLYGFLNFCLSLPACFLALALWLRYLARPNFARWCLVLAGLTALYFTHLLGFAFAGLIVAAYCIFARRTMREMAFSALLFLPGALFYLHSSRAVTAPGGYIEFPSFAERAASLVDIMHGYSTRLDIVTLLAFAAYFAAAWWRNPEFRWNRSWLGVAAVLFAAYWAMPWAYGDGSEINIRVLPVFFIVLLVSAGIGRRGKQLAALAVLLFVVRTANLAQQFRSAQPALANLAQSFEKIPVNARVLPLVESDEDPIWRPFTHFWGYGVIERGWLCPYLFHLPQVMPLQVRGDLKGPEGFWDLAYDEEPDWETVRENYDYVWAYNVARFSAGLESIGEPIYENGYLEIYRLRRDSGSRR
jgi:hypothetical protein